MQIDSSGQGGAACGSSPPAVVVRGTGELIAVIPYYLGFVPGRSVVIATLSAGLLSAAMRLPCPPSGWDGLSAGSCRDTARALRTAARLPPSGAAGGACPDGAVLLGFGPGLPPGPGHAGTPGRQPDSCSGCEDAESGLVRACQIAEAAGLAVLAAAVVAGDRWRPQHDRAGWQAVPEPASVAAVSELVGAGVAPLASREALLARLMPDPARCAPVARAWEPIRSGADPLDPDAGAAAWREWLTEPGIASCGQEARLTAHGLALLRVAAWRDAAYARVAPQLAGPGAALRRRAGPAGESTDAASLLAQVAPAAPPGARGDLLAVIAVAAWSAGRGPEAVLAAGEALRDDPAQAMAPLVLAALGQGLRADPRSWGRARSA